MVSAMKKVADIFFYGIAFVIVVSVVRNVVLNIEWLNNHCHTHVSHHHMDAGE